jgi:hypothetical protein
MEVLDQEIARDRSRARLGGLHQELRRELLAVAIHHSPGGGPPRRAPRGGGLVGKIVRRKESARAMGGEERLVDGVVLEGEPAGEIFDREE